MTTFSYALVHDIETSATTLFANRLTPLVVIATTTAGTAMVDFADRSLGVGYPGGVSLLADRGNPRDRKNGSLLDEGATHLIGDWLEEIAHHRPASRLHEDLGRHSRHELLTGKSPTLLV